MDSKIFYLFLPGQEFGKCRNIVKMINLPGKHRNLSLRIGFPDAFSSRIPRHPVADDQVVLHSLSPFRVNKTLKEDPNLSGIPEMHHLSFEDSSKPEISRNISDMSLEFALGV
jgi:hypothetical protein